MGLIENKNIDIVENTNSEIVEPTATELIEEFDVDIIDNKKRKLRGKFSKADFIKMGVVVLLILLTLFNATTYVYDKVYYESSMDSTKEYFDEVYDVNSDAFLVLSVTKAGLAVIEGSTFGGGIVVEAQIELGDVVQPLYDLVDVVWYVTLFNTIFSLLISNFNLVFSMALLKWLLIVILSCYLMHKIYSRLKGNSANTSMFGNLFKGISIIAMFIYFILPLAFLVSSKVSDNINTSMYEKNMIIIEDDLEVLGEKKDNLLDISFTTFEKDLDAFTEKAGESVNVIGGAIPKIIVALILTSFVIPIVLIVVLYKIFVVIFKAIVENIVTK